MSSLWILEQNFHLILVRDVISLQLMDFVVPKKIFQEAGTYQLLPSEYFTFF